MCIRDRGSTVKECHSMLFFTFCRGNLCLKRKNWITRIKKKKTLCLHNLTGSKYIYGLLNLICARKKDVKYATTRYNNRLSCTLNWQKLIKCLGSRIQRWHNHNTSNTKSSCCSWDKNHITSFTKTLFYFFISIIKKIYSIIDVISNLSLIHIWRCRRSTLCRSRWSPYH